jgi:ribosomal protein S27AE
MPEERKVLPFYSSRLRDLVQPRAKLVLTCGACGHVGELDALLLMARPLVGPDEQVRDLQKRFRFRCGKCQMRDWVRLEVA